MLSGAKIMDNWLGHATYRRGKLYFDETGWAIVKKVAKRAKKSPQTVVIAGLKRGMKLHGAKSSGKKG